MYCGFLLNACISMGLHAASHKQIFLFRFLACVESQILLVYLSVYVCVSAFLFIARLAAIKKATCSFVCLQRRSTGVQNIVNNLMLRIACGSRRAFFFLFFYWTKICSNVTPIKMPKTLVFHKIKFISISFRSSEKKIHRKNKEKITNKQRIGMRMHMNESWNRHQSNCRWPMRSFIRKTFAELNAGDLCSHGMRLCIK